MPRAILYDYYRSSACYRVRIALNLKRIEYETRSINLATGAQKNDSYRDLNPQGFVPMLVMDGQTITQSLAICDFLDAAIKQPPFVRHDPADGAHVLALALTVACDIHPLNNLRILKYLESELGADEVARNQWYRHWVADGLAALEALAAPRAGSWLFGEEPSLADICLVPQLYNARRFKVPLDPYPTLNRADATAAAHPAFAAAHPDRQLADRQEQPA